MAANADPSNYVQVRLTVHRYGERGIAYAVVVRTVGGGLRRDQMRARGVAPSPPDSAASTDPVEALRAALDHLLSTRAGRRIATSGAPQGPTGVVCPGQLRLDLPQ
jgi:hypothetical protein